MQPYNISELEMALKAQNTSLIYVAETGSTMDIASEEGLIKSVVVTDHQTAGRGRYSRQWNDDAGSSILATFVGIIPRQVMPPVGSLLLSHLFVLAVQQAIASPAVAIRWPNDLAIADKKVGGVLLNEGQQTADQQAVLFGVGLNVFGQNSDERASLDSVTPRLSRASLITAIDATLDTFLADLARLDTPTVRNYYDELWQQSSALLGRSIEVTGYGKNSDEQLAGTVTASPFGQPLQLTLDDGGILEVRDYGHQAHIKVRPS